MNINNLSAGSYRLAVYDALGNPIEFKEIKIAALTQTIGVICDQRFSGGVYVFNLTGNGKALSTKCIVQ